MKTELTNYIIEKSGKKFFIQSFSYDKDLILQNEVDYKQLNPENFLSEVKKSLTQDDFEKVYNSFIGLLRGDFDDFNYSYTINSEIIKTDIRVLSKGHDGEPTMLIGTSKKIK